MIIFSAGMSNSFSVYTLLFLFKVASALVFGGLGGAPLLLDFRDLDIPSFWLFRFDLLFFMPDLFVACFDFTVVVLDGAMMFACGLMNFKAGEVAIKDKR